MKLSKLALASAIAGLLSAGTAYAQSGLGQPSSVQQTAFEYNSYYAQDYDERAGAKERGVEGDDGLGAVGKHDGDPCSRLHPQLTQADREAHDLPPEVSVGDRGPEKVGGHDGRVTRGVGCQFLECHRWWDDRRLHLEHRQDCSQRDQSAQVHRFSQYTLFDAIGPYHG